MRYGGGIQEKKPGISLRHNDSKATFENLCLEKGVTPKNVTKPTKHDIFPK